jgi:hypothetical protein
LQGCGKRLADRQQHVSTLAIDTCTGIASTPLMSSVVAGHVSVARRPLSGGRRASLHWLVASTNRFGQIGTAPCRSQRVCAAAQPAHSGQYEGRDSSVMVPAARRWMLPRSMLTARLCRLELGRLRAA